MRIDRLTLRNFKGFEERTFEFQPEFNLLIGENGSGKSSTLQACAIAIGDWTGRFPAASFPTFRDQFVRIKRNEIRDTVRFEKVYPADIRFEGEIGDIHFDLVHEANDNHVPHPESDRFRLGVLAGTYQKRITEEEDLTLPIALYHSPRRGQNFGSEWVDRESAGPFEDKSNLSRFAGYRNSLEGSIDLDTVRYWLRREQFVALQEGKESVTYSVAKIAMLGCLEGGIELEYNVKEADLFVRFEQSGWQPLSNLSDGQRGMLALVGDIAYRCAWLNPHLGESALTETPGIVLIDELDLHLHPQWQRRVIGDLKRTFPKIQFICTTHSPFLIQSLQPGELIHLDKPDGQFDYTDNSIEDIVEEIQGIEMPQRSKRQEVMQEAAETYFSLLRQKETVSPSVLEEAEKKYRVASEAYTNQPAVNALLQLETHFAEKRSSGE